MTLILNCAATHTPLLPFHPEVQLCDIWRKPLLNSLSSFLSRYSVFHTLESSLSSSSCVMFYCGSLQSFHSCHPAKMLCTFKLINLVEKPMNWVILSEHSLFLQVSSYLQILRLPWLWGYPIFLPVFNAQLWLVRLKISRLEKQIPQLKGICTADGSVMLSTWLSCLVSSAVCLLMLQN